MATSQRCSRQRARRRDSLAVDMRAFRLGREKRRSGYVFVKTERARPFIDRCFPPPVPPFASVVVSLVGQWRCCSRNPAGQISGQWSERDRPARLQVAGDDFGEPDFARGPCRGTPAGRSALARRLIPKGLWWGPAARHPRANPAETQRRFKRPIGCIWTIELAVGWWSLPGVRVSTTNLDAHSAETVGFG